MTSTDAVAATDTLSVETTPDIVILEPEPQKRGRWIEHWDPDNDEFWERSGSKIAKKNLIWSMFAEHIGFSVWVLWTIVVLNLANHGITLSVSELFLLTLHSSQTEKPRCSAKIEKIRLRFAVLRPVASQKTGSSGSQ